MSIVAFWEQTSPETELTQVQLCRDIPHLCSIRASALDLCAQEWGLDNLEQ